MFASFNARALGLNISSEEAIDLAATTGFAGIDLMVRDLVDAGCDPTDLRQRLDDRGLRPGAWPIAIRWRDTDDATFRRDLDRLAIYAEAAQILGLSRTGTWIMPEPPSDEPSWDDARTMDFHVARLGKISRLLGNFGICLGLEVLGVESLRTAGRREFIAKMNDPKLQELVAPLDDDSGPIALLVDFWHLYAAAESVESVITTWGIDRVAWVHIADLPTGAQPDRQLMIDTVRGLPGDHGTIPIQAGLQCLEAAGYRGPVTIEPLADCPTLRGLSAQDAASRAARAWANLQPEPDEADHVSAP